jgi:hypothetical protein
LTFLDISNNNIGQLVLPEGWTQKRAASQEENDAHGGHMWYEHTDGREQNEDPGSKSFGVIALADAISGNGALSVLSLKSNDLRASGGKALAEGLKGNTVITKLDISSINLGIDSNYDQDMSGVVALADAIPDMGALSILNTSKNDMKGAEAGKALGDALATNTVLKELDLSGAYARPNMDVAFVKAFAPGLSDNGALIKLDIGSNHIGAEQERDLQRICVAGGIELAK